jgi:hypothetical protein
MTGVSRPLKTKYINVDTRFRDDFDSTVKTGNVNISLPQRLTKVRSLRVTNAEVPYSYYNVSASLQNSAILVTTNTGVTTNYVIADGTYSANASNTISSYFGSHPINPYITYNKYNTNYSQFVFTPTGSVTSVTLQFAVDTLGNFNKLDLKGKIGWLLGFRQASYVLTSASPSIVSEAIADLNGARYLYLCLDEFTQNTNDNTFISPMYRSIVPKNIVARMNPSVFPLSNYVFGDAVFTPNQKDGTLVSDTRYYNNVDLQRLQVSLVNEAGQYINLNGLDYSFLLEIETE